MPARIIFSTLNSPTYNFDKFISLLFNEYLLRPKYLLKNSFELKKSLNSLIIPEDYKLISLDVISLFTNLHADLIIAGIKNK